MHEDVTSSIIIIYSVIVDRESVVNIDQMNNPIEFEADQEDSCRDLEELVSSLKRKRKRTYGEIWVPENILQERRRSHSSTASMAQHDDLSTLVQTVNKMFSTVYLILNIINFTCTRGIV